MALYHSPRIVTDGLRFFFDAANTKCLDSRENLCPVNSIPDAVYDVEDTVIRAPDGNASRRFYEGTTDLSFALARTFSSTVAVEAGKQYNFSCYIRQADAGRAFRLQWDGATTAFGGPLVQGFNPATQAFFSSFGVTGQGFETFSNGWYRFWFVTPVAVASSSTITPRIYMVNTAGNLLTDQYDDSGNLSVYYYGPQITTGAEIKPYVRTTGTAITLPTTATDLGRFNNNASLVGAPGYSLAGGGTAVFDGVNDSIETSMNDIFVDYSQQITIEAWINVPASAVWNNEYEGSIVGRGQFGGSHGLFRSLTNNQIRAWFRQSGATFGAVSAVGSISRDTWTQCAAIWTGGAAQLYINGTLAQSVNGSLALNTNTQPFVIGGRNTAGGATASWFTGNIANVKIYDRVLSASEVRQNFEATRWRYDI